MSNTVFNNLFFYCIMLASCERKPLLLKALAEVDRFTYLSSVMFNDGDCSIDIKTKETYQRTITIEAQTKKY